MTSAACKRLMQIQGRMFPRGGVTTEATMEGVTQVPRIPPHPRVYRADSAISGDTLRHLDVKLAHL